MTTPYVDQTMMRDLNDPPPKCCDEARTGWCICGDRITEGFPHDHEIAQLLEMAVSCGA